MRVRWIVSVLAAGFTFSPDISHAQSQPCPTHTLSEIANAVRSSARSPQSVISRSCMWGGAAIKESSGRLCAQNGNNFGVLQLSRQNIARLGLTPEQYKAQSLQEQVDGWALAGAADNNQSSGYRRINSNIESTVRFGHVMDGVLAACSQFGPVICNNDIALIDQGQALPLAGGAGAIPCKEFTCGHGTGNQDGNGETIVSWGLRIQREIYDFQCVD